MSSKRFSFRFLQRGLGGDRKSPFLLAMFVRLFVHALSFSSSLSRKCSKFQGYRLPIECGVKPIEQLASSQNSLKYSYDSYRQSPHILFFAYDTNHGRGKWNLETNTCQAILWQLWLLVPWAGWIRSQKDEHQWRQGQSRAHSIKCIPILPRACVPFFQLCKFFHYSLNLLRSVHPHVSFIIARGLVKREDFGRPRGSARYRPCEQDYPHWRYAATCCASFLSCSSSSQVVKIALLTLSHFSSNWCRTQQMAWKTLTSS